MPRLHIRLTMSTPALRRAQALAAKRDTHPRKGDRDEEHGEEIRVRVALRKNHQRRFRPDVFDRVPKLVETGGRYDVIERELKRSQEKTGAQELRSIYFSERIQ